MPERERDQSQTPDAPDATALGSASATPWRQLAGAGVRAGVGSEASGVRLLPHLLMGVHGASYWA